MIFYMYKLRFIPVLQKQNPPNQTKVGIRCSVGIYFKIWKVWSCIYGHENKYLKFEFKW